MRLSRSGIVLLTENYRDCVAFYRDTLGLPVLFALDRPGSVLTGFDFGGAYLLVEDGGHARPGGKTAREAPMKLRFNVEDLDQAVTDLQARGVNCVRCDHDWGSVADFHDPDGNPCQLRSEHGFGV
jgi:lactoylglutathione lyase